MHLHVPVAALTFSLFVGVAPVSAQALADLAKKAADSRKAVKKDAKVYTNADAGNVLASTAIPPGDKSTAAAPAADAAQAAQTPAADAGPDKGTQKEQALWAEKFKTLNSQLERDMVFADAIQTRINILSADLVNNDLGQRPDIEQNRNRALSELARLQKSIADDRKAITDFEEEARRNGVPPGWLR